MNPCCIMQFPLLCIECWWASPSSYEVTRVFEEQNESSANAACAFGAGVFGLGFYCYKCGSDTCYGGCL